MPKFRYSAAERAHRYEVAQRLVATEGRDRDVWELMEALTDAARAHTLEDFADVCADPGASAEARERALQIRAKHPGYRRPDGLEWVSDEAIVSRAQASFRPQPEIWGAWAEFCKSADIDPEGLYP